MRLYVDDIRATPHGFDLRTFDYEDTIAALQVGNVTFISLDHDLDAEGELDINVTRTGYDIACWIEARAAEGTLPRMAWHVHSMNPSGAARIRQAMESADVTLTYDFFELV